MELCIQQNYLSQTMENKGIFSQTKNKEVYFQEHLLKEFEKKAKWFGMKEGMVSKDNSKHVTKFK